MGRVSRLFAVEIRMGTVSSFLPFKTSKSGEGKSSFYNTVNDGRIIHFCYSRLARVCHLDENECKYAEY